MLRESQTAVVARNEVWEGAVATEPYEAGWATEAVIFVRALAFRSGGSAWSPTWSSAWSPSGSPTFTAPEANARPVVAVRVQISADGMRWIDEGATCNLPVDTGRDSFVRVGHFGNWIRIAADLPEGLAIKALVTMHLK
jgi:hypothetical protein